MLSKMIQLTALIFVTVHASPTVFIKNGEFQTMKEMNCGGCSNPNCPNAEGISSYLTRFSKENCQGTGTIRRLAIVSDPAIVGYCPEDPKYNGFCSGECFNRKTKNTKNPCPTCDGTKCTKKKKFHLIKCSDKCNNCDENGNVQEAVDFAECQGTKNPSTGRCSLCDFVWKTNHISRPDCQNDETSDCQWMPKGTCNNPQYDRKTRCCKSCNSMWINYRPVNAHRTRTRWGLGKKELPKGDEYKKMTKYEQLACLDF